MISDQVDDCGQRRRRPLLVFSVLVILNCGYLCLWTVPAWTVLFACSLIHCKLNHLFQFTVHLFKPSPSLYCTLVSRTTRYTLAMNQNNNMRCSNRFSWCDTAEVINSRHLTCRLQLSLESCRVHITILMLISLGIISLSESDHITESSLKACEESSCSRTIQSPFQPFLDIEGAVVFARGPVPAVPLFFGMILSNCT